jgi:hypothetical protein
MAVQTNPKTQPCPDGLATPRTCPFGGACHTCPAPIQAKLVVGAPDDKYEKEADRIADEVMRMPDPRLQRSCSTCAEDEQKVRTKPLADQITPLVQRQADPTEEEEEIQPKLEISSIQRQPEDPEDEEEPIQAKRDEPGALGVPARTADLIRGLRGRGRFLSSSERGFFEPRFGRSLGSVRLHRGPVAESTSHTLRARAYTHRQNIALGRSSGGVETRDGRRLLAHELVHTIQQGAVAPGRATVQRRGRKPTGRRPRAPAPGKKKTPKPRSASHLVLFAAGYPSRVGRSVASEVRAVDGGYWMPSSRDFHATAAGTGATPYACKMGRDIQWIERFKNIRRVSLIGHGGPGFFRFSASSSGVLDPSLLNRCAASARYKGINWRTRFKTGATWTYYCCNTGAKASLLQATASAYGVKACGFKQMLEWRIRYSGSGKTAKITRRGEVAYRGGPAYRNPSRLTPDSCKR